MPHQSVRNVNNPLLISLTLGLASCHIVALAEHWRTSAHQVRSLASSEQSTMVIETLMIIAGIFVSSLILTSLIIRLVRPHPSNLRLARSLQITSGLMLIFLVPNFSRWGFTEEMGTALLVWFGLHAATAITTDRMVEGIP